MFRQAAIPEYCVVGLTPTIHLMNVCLRRSVVIEWAVHVQGQVAIGLDIDQDVRLTVVQTLGRLKRSSVW